MKVSVKPSCSRLVRSSFTGALSAKSRQSNGISGRCPPKSQGPQLETSSLWDNPILCNTKDYTEVRANVNRGPIRRKSKNFPMTRGKTMHSATMLTGPYLDQIVPGPMTAKHGTSAGLSEATPPTA